MKTFTTTMYLSLFVVLNIIVSSSVVVLGNELQDTQGGTQSITYLFGSAWPTCKAFGSGDFQTIYKNYAKKVNIEFIPAIPYSASGTPICADETSCDWEKVTLCAFNNTNANLETNLKFLDCMDLSKLPLFYEPTIPKQCALNNKIDFDQVTTCFNGKQGDYLLHEGMIATINKVGKGSFTLPTVLVNEKIACTSTQCNYKNVVGKLNNNNEETTMRMASNNSSNNDSPSITYFFASRWPLCRHFGSSDWIKVFTNFGGDNNKDATLSMVPAVRSLNGTCVDSPNCYYERITLCAFNLTTSGLKGQVDFLDCMDSPWDVELKPNKPYKCAKGNNIDGDQLKKCSDGPLGDELMKIAMNKMNKQFPKKVFLPQIVVDGVVIDADYDTIQKKACADGSSASVCSSA